MAWNRPVLQGLAIGTVAGLALFAAVVGVGLVHRVCVEGPEIGWSGPLASPLAIVLAPPGGLVNFSFWIETVFNPDYSTGFGGGSAIPANNTFSDFEVVNWTLNASSSAEALGWGPSTPCPVGYLGPSGVTGQSEMSACAGCPLAPPVPPGVGHRLTIPQPLGQGSIPYAIVNLSYPATPIATLGWDIRGAGIQWTNPIGLGPLNVAVGPFYFNGSLLGLGLTLPLDQIDFGVWFHLSNGGSEVLPASFPADWIVGPQGGSSMTMSMTYVLPASTDQGEWEVFLPGNGGAFSPGGLLFEQINTTASVLP